MLVSPKIVIDRSTSLLSDPTLTDGYILNGDKHSNRFSLSGDGVTKLGPLSDGVVVNCSLAEGLMNASDSSFDSFFFFDQNLLSKPDFTRDKADRLVNTSVAVLFDS